MLHPEAVGTAWPQTLLEAVGPELQPVPKKAEVCPSARERPEVRLSRAGQQGLVVGVTGRAEESGPKLKLQAEDEREQSHRPACGPWEGGPRQKPDSNIAGLFPLLNLLEEPTSSVAKAPPVGTEPRPSPRAW